MTMSTHFPRAAALLAACAMALAGAHAQVQAPGAAGSIRVLQASAAPSLKGSTTGMAFVDLHNAGSSADRLVALSSPAAARVELHEMQMSGDVMKMRQLDGVALAPGQQLHIDGSTLHVMLIGLKQPLKAGDSVPLTLRFEHGGSVTTTLPVQAKPADPGIDDHTHHH